MFRIVWLRIRCKEALSQLQHQTFDVVAKTWVFGARKEVEENDFYYGDLQKRLQDNGTSVLLLCGNVSKSDWKNYALVHTVVTGLCRLPELCLIPPWRTCQIVFKQIVASFRLWFASKQEPNSLLKRILTQVAVDSLREQTLANNLYYWLGRETIKTWNPKMFLTFYEGHAWEKCLWLGVKEENPACKVAGYQHTVIMQHAYEQLHPFLDPSEQPTPNIVFCTGLESLNMMKSDYAGCKPEFVPFGSFRFSANFSDNVSPDPSRRAVLVIPEGVLSEAVMLFDFAIKLSSLLPDYRFIFRCHPMLPFERVKPRLFLERGVFPDNVEISNHKEIDDDFNQSSSVLYRGSSAVLYAILKGLKPYYLRKNGEETIDPIFKLNVWREVVDSPRLLATRLRTFEVCSTEQLQAPFQTAEQYVRNYIMPVDQAAMDRFLETFS